MCESIPIKASQSYLLQAKDIEPQCPTLVSSLTFSDSPEGFPWPAGGLGHASYDKVWKQCLKGQWCTVYTVPTV